MILRVDRVGGRARVIIDEERVLRQGWTEMEYAVQTRNENRKIPTPIIPLDFSPRRESEKWNMELSCQFLLVNKNGKRK